MCIRLGLNLNTAYSAFSFQQKGNRGHLNKAFMKPKAREYPPWPEEELWTFGPTDRMASSLRRHNIFWRHHIGPTAGLLTKRAFEALRHPTLRHLRRWLLPPMTCTGDGQRFQSSPGVTQEGLSWAQPGQGEDWSLPVLSAVTSPALCTYPELCFLLQALQHRCVSSAIETGKFKQMPIIPFHP